MNNNGRAEEKKRKWLREMWRTMESRGGEMKMAPRS